MTKRKTKLRKSLEKSASSESSDQQQELIGILAGSGSHKSRVRRARDLIKQNSSEGNYSSTDLESLDNIMGSYISFISTGSSERGYKIKSQESLERYFSKFSNDNQPYFSNISSYFKEEAPSKPKRTFKDTSLERLTFSDSHGNIFPYTRAPLPDTTSLQDYLGAISENPASFFDSNIQASESTLGNVFSTNSAYFSGASFERISTGIDEPYNLPVSSNSSNNQDNSLGAINSKDTRVNSENSESVKAHNSPSEEVHNLPLTEADETNFENELRSQRVSEMSAAIEEVLERDKTSLEVMSKIYENNEFMRKKARDPTETVSTGTLYAEDPNVLQSPVVLNKSRFNTERYTPFKSPPVTTDTSDSNYGWVKSTRRTKLGTVSRIAASIALAVTPFLGLGAIAYSYFNSSENNTNSTTLAEEIRSIEVPLDKSNSSDIIRNNESVVSIGESLGQKLNAISDNKSGRILFEQTTGADSSLAQVD